MSDGPGCTNCKGKAGCDDHKSGMFAAIEAGLGRLYPSRTWGVRDDVAGFEAGISATEGRELADALADSLDAATIFVPGEDGDLCDYIYVLCMGREPCLIHIRDGGVPIPHELAGARVSEQYLRVCLSAVANMAAVQQVAVDGDATGPAMVICERPRAGVYDAPLLPRFRRLVAEIQGRGIVHLDFGDITNPPPDFDPGAYPARYGGAQPAVANYFFFPQPATTEVASVVERLA